MSGSSADERVQTFLGTAPMIRGLVVAIHIAPAASAPMRSVPAVEAIAGRGLAGDRYANGIGTYSRHPGSGREVTLIELEAIEALRRDHAIELEAAQSRRNIVTRGVPLNHLVGREFTVGSARLRGTRLCDPCAHLEKLTTEGVMRGLIDRGGLRAEIVDAGTISVGAGIEL